MNKEPPKLSTDNGDKLSKLTSALMHKCSINNCESYIKAKGLCSKHYERVRRNQDPGINYQSRQHRIMLNDSNAFTQSKVNCYELQALREIFFLGKHHAGLTLITTKH